MPLSRAVLAVIALFYAVGYWSAWFNASIYLTDQDMMPLQNVMIQIVQKQEPPTGLGQVIRTGRLSPLSVQMAVMVMALLPVAVVSALYPEALQEGHAHGRGHGLSPRRARRRATPPLLPLCFPSAPSPSPAPSSEIEVRTCASTGSRTDALPP